MILLLDHSTENGARGIMLTDPLPTAVSTLMEASVGINVPASTTSDSTSNSSSQNSTPADKDSSPYGRVGGGRGRAGSEGFGGSAGSVEVRHMMGGPVGMPLMRPGTYHELTFVHTMPGVHMARPLLDTLHGTATAYDSSSDDEGDEDVAEGDTRGSGASAGSRLSRGWVGGASMMRGGNTLHGPASRQLPPQVALYYGGSLSEILEKAAASGQQHALCKDSHVGAAARQQTNNRGQSSSSRSGRSAECSGSATSTGFGSSQVSMGNQTSTSTSDCGAHAVGSTPTASCHKVLVYHGLCGWAEGQLEGELRSGSWALAPATAADLRMAAASPEDLWAHLIASSRLRWL